MTSTPISVLVSIALTANAQTLLAQSLLAERIEAPIANYTAPGNRFGTAISSDGTLLVIGSPQENIGSANARGAAYVFELVDARYEQRAQLVASDGAAGDQFGAAVAIAGNRIVIGAPEEDNNGGTGAGAAYVFQRNGQNWTQQQKLLAPDGATGDAFGYAVAISGNNLVIGAPFDNLEGSLVNAGSAHWFGEQANNWQYRQRVIDSVAVDNSHFGRSMALSNTVLAIGAPDFNQQRGAVSLMSIAASPAVLTERYAEPDAQVGDFFGDALAVSAQHLAIGRPGGLLRTGANRGAVIVQGLQLPQSSVLLDPLGVAGDRFGAALQISGAQVIVGAPRVNFNSCCEFGRVSTFSERMLGFGRVWQLDEQINDRLGMPFDAFGASVAFSPLGVLVGVPSSDAPTGLNDAGSVLHFMPPFFKDGFE
jgi:hypothetical protein